MEATAMKATTIGIDLAKNVFQIHGVDERGNLSVKTKLKRAQVAAFFINLPPWWGWRLAQVRIFGPESFKPWGIRYV
jgi:transposase